jgi:hypothetical protein
MDKQKAATAIARKLLVVAWNVLAKREVDREANPDKVGASMMDWGMKHRLASSLGLKRVEFTGKQLSKLGIQLERVTYCKRVHKIPKMEPAKSSVLPKKRAALTSVAVSKGERRPKQKVSVNSR